MVTEVASDLVFSAIVVAAADAILQQLSGQPFYGLHLRTEGDVEDLKLGVSHSSAKQPCAVQLCYSRWTHCAGYIQASPAKQKQSRL
jgi:hypothetical protein